MTCLLQQELSIKSGDRLVVFGDPDVEGFYYAELEGGRRGYVPADCLQPAAAAAGPVSSSRTASSDRRSSSRPSADRPFSSSSAAAASGHRGVGDQPHATSSSAPPPSTRHHHDGSSSRSTGRRQPRDDSVELTAGGRSSSATLPRSAERTRTSDLAATGDAGGRGGTADSSTRHRRQ